ncbi:MAG: translational GTPase TypA [Planctomycetota bacterium]
MSATPALALSMRNVAIIAHVDHGKTTLVDGLLYQSGMFRSEQLDKLAGGQHGLIMDSNDLERERGITILSKQCAVTYTRENGEQIRINIIDTPGHADFGGEVDRVLRMADGCLLLVDCAEGPMPQTRFVLGKAIEAGLEPVVVVNKCDRQDARGEAAVDEVFDLLVELGADDHALDFPVVWASGRSGWAVDSWQTAQDVVARQRTGETIGPPEFSLRPVFESIVEHVPAAKGESEGPLQVLVTSIAYSEYVGRIGIGRVFRGSVRKGQQIVRIDRDGHESRAKIGGLEGFEGLGRVERSEIGVGDLCAVIGVEGVDIGDTLADPERPEALPPVSVDEPTLSMVFRVNDSPFGGKEGEFVTSRQLRDRLARESEKNVALRVEPGEGGDEFIVAGRGMLHLGVLLEEMRREGFELSVGKPHVVLREHEGVIEEPIERLVIDVPESSVGPVMELVGNRRGEMVHMEPRGDMTHLVFDIPARGLIGLRSKVMTASAGEAILSHAFERWAPKSGEVPGRANGVLIASEPGQITAHALEALADRGVMFVEPGDQVYAGQVVGEHNRENDLTVNACRAKQLTNFRESTKEATVRLKSARKMELEKCIEYVEEDELVELTPTAVRLRKKMLNESDRKKAARSAKDKVTKG